MAEYKTFPSVDPEGKQIDGRFVYRGVIFVRDDRFKGYWGHYRTVSGGVKLVSATRLEMTKLIDQILTRVQ